MASENNNILVHGVFLYRCEKCGAIEPMYLEQGVEGPNKKQPCPYAIRCISCDSNNMVHVMFGLDNFFMPRALEDNESYFALGNEHGKPIFRKL